MSIEDELKEIKAELEKERDADVIQRTLSKLIAIEKEAIYGSRTMNRSARIEKLIHEEFVAYKEVKNANSKD